MTVTTATQFRRGVAPLPTPGTAAFVAGLVLCALLGAPNRHPAAQSLPANSSATQYLVSPDPASPALGTGWQRQLMLLNLDTRRLDIAVSAPDHHRSRAANRIVSPGKADVLDLATAGDSDPHVLEARATGKYAAYVALMSADRRQLEIAGSIVQTARQQIFPVLVRRAQALTTLTLFNPATGDAERGPRGTSLPRQSRLEDVHRSG